MCTAFGMTSGILQVGRVGGRARDIGEYWGYHIFKNFMVILWMAGWVIANGDGLNGCFVQMIVAVKSTEDLGRLYLAP